MQNLNIKRATISAIIVWTLGVTAFVGSYLVPIMEDPEAQANWVLSLAIIPAAAFGAYLYYRKGQQTIGLVLGTYMFLITMILDASITVPVFILPYGGTHLTFFGDPGFWLIAIEYISVVTGYWLIRKKILTIA